MIDEFIFSIFFFRIAQSSNIKLIYWNEKWTLWSHWFICDFVRSIHWGNKINIRINKPFLCRSLSVSRLILYSNLFWRTALCLCSSAARFHKLMQFSSISFGSCLVSLNWRPLIRRPGGQCLDALQCRLPMHSLINFCVSLFWANWNRIACFDWQNCCCVSAESEHNMSFPSRPYYL